MVDQSTSSKELSMSGPQCFEISFDMKFDFHKLALVYPQLRQKIKIINGITQIDFSDQKSLIVLTQSLMKVVFGVEWLSSQENLCPRVPNRVNYLLWIQRFGKSLLKSKSIQTLIDIGTGSSLIYPLIGVSMFGWNFLATDIDERSLRNCQNILNVNQEKYPNSIQLLHSKSPFILKGNVLQTKKIDILMCNPPFFDSESKQQPLGQMLPNQHNTKGGQYEFFFDLYMESFSFVNIEVFTMMIGKMTTWTEIVHFLQQEYRLGVLKTFRVGKLNQGKNTRFVICWKVNHQD